MADEPPISDQEAIDRGRRLYRKFMGAECPAPVKITTGNRRTWRRNGLFLVNPNGRKNGNRRLRWLYRKVIDQGRVAPFLRVDVVREPVNVRPAAVVLPSPIRHSALAAIG